LKKSEIHDFEGEISCEAVIWKTRLEIYPDSRGFALDSENLTSFFAFLYITFIVVADFIKKNSF
jgi:hypothetical protein